MIKVNSEDLVEDRVVSLAHSDVDAEDKLDDGEESIVEEVSKGGAHALFPVEAPARLACAVWLLDRRLLLFCRHRGKIRLQELLALLGRQWSTLCISIRMKSLLLTEPRHGWRLLPVYPSNICQFTLERLAGAALTAIALKGFDQEN